jgi:hypothetical protein
LLQIIDALIREFVAAKPSFAESRFGRSVRFSSVQPNFCGGASFGSAEVATISSTEPVRVAGHSISPPGVSSWPLVTGDEIATSTAPATILFRDGSSVALAAKSSALLTGTSTQPKLVLMVGSLNYKIVPGSHLLLSRSTADNDTGNGSSADSGSIGPSSPAASIPAHGLSHAAIIAGVLAATAAVVVIPVETLTHSSPASLPNLSAR